MPASHIMRALSLAVLGVAASLPRSAEAFAVVGRRAEMRRLRSASKKPVRMSPTDGEADADDGKDWRKQAEAKQKFWDAQRALAGTMQAQSDRSLKEEQLAKYAVRRQALVNETVLWSVVLFSGLWLISDSPFAPLSYALGAGLGAAYSYGLGRYVESIGGSADEQEDVAGAGVGSARFAFLILLFLFVGKFKSFGLQEIPSIVGFFTYQLASLSQGLKEYND